MSRGSQRDMLQSKAKGNRLRIMYPLELKSVAYESEYISTGNISRNTSFRLPYLCAIFLKCLFTLRCMRKARKGKGRAGLDVAGQHSRYFSLETSTLPEKLDSSSNEFMLLSSSFFLCLARVYRAPPIAKIFNPSSKCTRKRRLRRKQEKTNALNRQRIIPIRQNMARNGQISRENARAIYSKRLFVLI